MHLGLLPIVILIAIGLLVLAATAFIRAVKGKGGRKRIAILPLTILMTCCTILWLGLCFFFMVLAALGHSAHPLRDCWPQCLVSFLVVIVAPSALLAWLTRRKSG